MNGICSAELGSRYATRFAFGVVEPALKRGAKLDCRYRGKATLVTGKALDWKRGPTLDCRYRGKVTLITKKALNWKRAPTLDCRYRGKGAAALRISAGSAAAALGGCSVSVPTDEI